MKKCDKKFQKKFHTSHRLCIGVVPYLYRLCWLWICCIFGWQSIADELQRFTFLQAQMGVPFRIILYAPNRQKAAQAAEMSFKRIQSLNQTLSHYETDSELSRLGFSGRSGWTNVSPDLFRIISHSQNLAQISAGAFDLTIGPIAASWRNARRKGKFPNLAQLARFRSRVGWRNLKLDYSRKQVRLCVEGMRLDASGIAKGDALDQALHELRQAGIDNALVSGGGEIAVSEAPPKRKAWRIRLSGFDENFDETKNQKSFVNLKNQAIATSGDLYQFVEIDGIRYSHIVNPKTGIGLTERRIVSVIASRCILADALSTALSVVPLEQVSSILNAYPNTSARILIKSKGTQTEHRFGAFPLP